MSPAEAVLMAACKSPPAGTSRVAPKVTVANIKKVEAMAKALVILGEMQRCAAAHNWEIDNFCSSR